MGEFFHEFHVRHEQACRLVGACGWRATRANGGRVEIGPAILVPGLARPGLFAAAPGLAAAPAARAAAVAATLVPARRRAVFDRLAPVGRGRCMAGLAWMGGAAGHGAPCRAAAGGFLRPQRSEEHTSELQSPCNLVCRLLLEKKKKKMQ